MNLLLTTASPAVRRIAAQLRAQIQAATSFDDIRHLTVPVDELEKSLALGLLNLHLLGRAQVWAEVEDNPRQSAPARFARVVLEEDFEPLPFEAAIAYFRSKVTLTPEEFYALTEAARVKAFTISIAAETQIIESIRDLVDTALAEGLTLKEFQSQAGDVLSRAGVSTASPWYLELVYRNNLQLSYQVGRWQQMTHPDVAIERPYLRYVSARIPTSRPSHTEKHGVIFPIHHSFWDQWMVPNGHNCLPCGQVINTARGGVPIEQVKHGDLVMTHEGRWQPVIELHRNLFNGALVKVTTSDGRVLRMTPNHKVFTRRGWIEVARLNPPDQIGDLTATLLYGVNAFHSASAPRRFQPQRRDIVQRDSLRLDCALALQHLREHTTSIDFNSRLPLGQIEIDPIGRERGIEDIGHTSSLQDSSKQRFPFCHTQFGDNVRFGMRFMSRFHSGAHLRSDVWSSRCRRLFQFYRRARDAGVSVLRQALRPMVMAAVKFTPPFRLRFSSLRVLFPHQRDHLSTGPSRDVKKRQEGRDHALRVNFQQPPNFSSSFQFLTVQPPQYSGGIFLSEDSNPINGGFESVLHSAFILHEPGKFVNIAKIESEPFSGLVYNLGVAEDHSYCVDGLILHNCLCTVMSVSPSLMERRGWHVSESTNFKYPHPDPGFGVNPGNFEAL